MKNLIFSVLFISTLLLAGCYESTQEITLNEDGSGILSNTNDMSALISMAKQMGGAEKMAEAGDQKIDSTFTLTKAADSIPGLSSQERDLARKGTAEIKLNLKDEAFSTKLNFPFANPEEIFTLNKLSGKILASTMKDQMGGMPGGGAAADEMPEPTSVDDYYTVEYANGELTKKVNKEKYAAIGSDKYLEGLKEAGGMGLNMKMNYIINLPRPATKVEGKSVKLSDDKKKVTISADINDFFEDASLLEFKIKY